MRFHQNTFTFVTRRPSVAPRDLKSFVYARLASFSLTERGLTKLLKSPETKLLPRDKGLYISIHHFKNDRETNWTELTFAKTSGTVTSDREKNWPIADRRVSTNDPRNNCGMHFGSRSLLISKLLYENLRRLISILNTSYFSPPKAECKCVYSVRML